MESWAEAVTGDAPEMVVQPLVSVVPTPECLSTSRIYIKNLHASTNVDDLRQLVAMVSNADVLNPYISRVHHGKRYAKFEVLSSDADELLRHFNLFCGVTLGAAAAEYART